MMKYFKPESWKIKMGEIMKSKHEAGELGGTFKNGHEINKNRIPHNKGVRGRFKNQNTDGLTLGRGWNKGMPNTWSLAPQVFYGDKSPNWRGGVTPLNLKIRNSIEYKAWRKQVFERDNYTCVWCGKRGGIIHADHINPFSLYPELRLEITNGRTLCIECHRSTDTYGAKTIKYRYALQ